MKWTSALSQSSELPHAIDEVAKRALEALGTTPDLCLLFASEHFRTDFERLPMLLREQLGSCTLLGCSASGVIGNAREIEQAPALSITCASLPNVTLECRHIEAADLRPGTQHSIRCTELAQRTENRPEQFIVLADPFSFPTEQLLRSLESGFKTSAIAGGLASGGQAPGEIVLFNDDAVHTSGALMLSLGGNITMHTAVAQGCRPIGDPMFVSACDGNKLSSLDGRPSSEIISELYENATDADRALMQHSLFIGITMKAGASRYEQGDFLIRNIGAGDADSSAIWVGADLHENQVVQFHVRDARTSAEDLDQQLQRLHQRLDANSLDAKNPGARDNSGGLLFSCIGRGEGLYGRANHDSTALQARLGPLALGGFFCNGEIGPVGGQSFIHGYTSSIAVFQSRD